LVRRKNKSGLVHFSTSDCGAAQEREARTLRYFTNPEHSQFNVKMRKESSRRRADRVHDTLGRAWEELSCWPVELLQGGSHGSTCNSSAGPRGRAQGVHVDSDQKFEALRQPVTLDRFVSRIGYAHWSFDEPDGRVFAAESFDLPFKTPPAQLEFGLDELFIANRELTIHARDGKRLLR